MDKQIDRYLVDQLAGLVGHNSSTFYWLHQYWDEPSDPRTRNYFLVHPSIISMALLMIVYMLLVVVIIPGFMRNRKPFNLKGLIIGYDVLMVCEKVFFDH
jgi:hypothetical protein